MSVAAVSVPPANSARRVLLASLVGTTIEFFDFYIYATAAVLVFPALFGHFGDRIGRKATLVAALLTMGVSTVTIGLLPGYAQIGVWAPALLALCRFGQGLGLGGEWGGAVLLATENAPPGKRAWYGMFPQFGAPLGFLLSTSTFLLLGAVLSDAQFTAWGWRIPFLASALLVLLGLWVRLRITETPDFQRAIDRAERVRLPLREVLSKHGAEVVLGTLATFATFALFYLMTVWALGHGTAALGYPKSQFLLLQMVGIVFFALGIPISARWGDRGGTAPAMIVASICIIAFGLCFAPLFVAGDALRVVLFLSVGFFFMGLTYGPCGTLLAQLYPVQVRYTGASLSFNLAGILGAAPAPYVATGLADRFGLAAVGAYLALVAAVSLGALLLSRRYLTR